MMSMTGCMIWAVALCAAQTPQEFKMETSQAVWVWGSDATTHQFLDKATGTDYAVKPGAPIARVRAKDAWQPATTATYIRGQLTLGFGDTGVSATLQLKSLPDYFIAELASVAGADATEIVFLDIPLTLKGVEAETFAVSGMALNLQTNSLSIPGPSKGVEALAYSRTGFQNARVAVAASPTPKIRDIMKTVVKAAPDIPQSNIGGPWAMDADINRGSYLFDFGKLTEATVDDWIACVKALGLTQIDFHTGTSLRFGDLTPNPKLFPNGKASVKAVTDKLHAAGISAGLHTYAFFIAKDSPFVTPVPDPRLGKDAAFTLAADLTAEATEVPVAETTEKMSTITGFFVHNSVTIQVDEELINYKQVRKEAPFAFYECERGAFGTKVAAHAKGAKVHHLKECFGLFTPDADSTMLADVAAKTAEAFNDCGFDMIYLDALDGEGILAGNEWAWHYGSKFVFEIAKRLNKPALFEMSTFHHHLWYVRARMGAWDTSLREHKHFADIHMAANRAMWNTFLPMNLGWWRVKTYDDGPFGTQEEPTFAEDVEYLMGKCIGADSSISVMGIDPEMMAASPAIQRLAPIFKEYETIRHAKIVSEEVKAMLRQPGACFTLTRDAQGGPVFVPTDHLRYKVAAPTGDFTVANRFKAQPINLRIEALVSQQPEGVPETILLEDFKGAAPKTSTAAKVALEATQQKNADGTASLLHLQAVNNSDSPRGAWTKAEYVYETPKDINKNQGLGVWVEGDNSGALLNVQLHSPEHTIHLGHGDHYITLNFTGWRYFELVEPDSGRIEDYVWPYGGAYSIYREQVDYAQIHSLTFWLNELPVGKTTQCNIRPVQALPLTPNKVSRPALRLGDKTITFPVDLESGQYLEYSGAGNALVYNKRGKQIQDVAPEGVCPELQPGDNAVTFSCASDGKVQPRTRLTFHVMQ